MAFLDEILKLLQVGQAPTPRMAGMEQQVRGLFGQPNAEPNAEPYADPFFSGGGPGMLANIPGPELTPQQAPPRAMPTTAPALPPDATPSAMTPGMLGNGQLPDMGRFSSDYVPERDTGMIAGGPSITGGPAGAVPTSGAMPFGLTPGAAPQAPAAGPAAAPNSLAQAPGNIMSGIGTSLGDLFRGTDWAKGPIGGLVAGHDRRQAANATIQFMKAKGVPDDQIAFLMANQPAQQAWIAQNMPIRRLPELKDIKRNGEELTIERDPITGALRQPTITEAPGTVAPVGGPQVAPPPPGVDVKEWRKEQAKLVSKNVADAPDALAKVDDALKTIEKIRTHPGRKIATGRMGLVPEAVLAGTPGADFIGLVEQVKGKAFLEAYQALKGGGAISEPEGRKAEQALARLQRTQSGPGFDEALKDFADVLTAAKQRIADKAGVKPTHAPWQEIEPGIWIRKKL